MVPANSPSRWPSPCSRHVTAPWSCQHHYHDPNPRHHCAIRPCHHLGRQPGYERQLGEPLSMPLLPFVTTLAVHNTCCAYLCCCLSWLSACLSNPRCLLGCLAASPFFSFDCASLRSNTRQATAATRRNATRRKRIERQTVKQATSRHGCDITFWVDIS